MREARGVEYEHSVERVISKEDAPKTQYSLPWPSKRPLIASNKAGENQICRITVYTGTLVVS